MDVVEHMRCCSATRCCSGLTYACIAVYLFHGMPLSLLDADSMLSLYVDSPCVAAYVTEYNRTEDVSVCRSHTPRLRFRR